MKRIVLLSLMLTLISNVFAQKYQNFDVAIYCRAYEVEKMKDPAWLNEAWNEISKQVHIDKIYLETHRDLLIVDDETLESAKKFFTDKGVKVTEFLAHYNDSVLAGRVIVTGDNPRHILENMTENIKYV